MESFRKSGRLGSYLVVVVPAFCSHETLQASLDEVSFSMISVFSTSSQVMTLSRKLYEVQVSVLFWDKYNLVLSFSGLVEKQSLTEIQVLQLLSASTVFGDEH